MSTLPFAADGAQRLRARWLLRAWPFAAAVPAHALVAAWLSQSRSPAAPLRQPQPKIVELVELPKRLPAPAQPAHTQPAPPRPVFNPAATARVTTPPVRQQPERAVEPPTAQPAPDSRAAAMPPAPSAVPSSTNDTAVAHADTPNGHAAPSTVDEPVSAPIGNADYLHNPAPDYPRAAKAHEWQGRVLLRFHVLASGCPDRVELQASSGHDVLDDAALAAVKNWLPSAVQPRSTDGSASR